MEDIFSAFGDVFGDIFGGRGHRRQSRGADLRCDVELDLIEAARGVSKNVEFEPGVTYTKAEYDTQVATNVATQEVINQVVGYITSRNYQDFPTVVALVEDATDQLGFAEEAKAKADAAAEKKDWQNAMLWANQWWQYQVKTADMGLRAKTYLDEHGAKVVK